MGDSLTYNHHYEQCSDTTSHSRCKNCLIPCQRIEHPLCLKVIRNRLKLRSLSMFVYKKCVLFQLIHIFVINTYAQMYNTYSFSVWGDCSKCSLKIGNCYEVSLTTLYEKQSSLYQFKTNIFENQLVPLNFTQKSLFKLYLKLFFVFLEKSI